MQGIARSLLKGSSSIFEIGAPLYQPRGLNWETSNRNNINSFNNNNNYNYNYKSRENNKKKKNKITIITMTTTKIMI